MKTFGFLCTSVLTLAATGLPQGPADAVDLQSRGPAPQITDAGTPSGPTLVDRSGGDARLAGYDLFYAPIRSGVDDNGHRYGTWASGPDYKVSFDGGMKFYPVLGTRYPDNLPVGWTTVEVRAGGQPLFDGEQPKETHSDWRYEYRFGTFVEAYDVEKVGVEQTFTFASRPAAAGDLVIRGQIDTQLVATPRGFENGGIVFRHVDGTAIVEYGAALAIDAAGRTHPMQSAWDGTSISLRLDADWLATAKFPLVVDPLLSRVLVSFDGANRQASSPEIARDDTANDLMVAYGRATSASDYDAYARLTNDDFSATQIVWSDVTASWSTRYMDAAFVGGADRWIIVLQRDFSGTTGSWLRYHVRDSGDLVASTAYDTLAGSSGNTLSFPKVGGTDAFSTGDNALVVYQSDTGLGNSSNSRVLAQLVDVRNSTNGSVLDLQTGSNFDRETPAVNQVSAGGSASWICCWTTLDNSISDDDWDLYIARVDATGARQGLSFLANASASVHAYQPKVAGRDGRYMVCYGEDSNGAGTQTNGWAPTIRSHRFDWSETASTPVKGDIELVRSSRSAEFWNGDIAYDSTTDSHWGIVFHGDDWNVYGARVGFDGGRCESVTVYNTSSLAFSPAMTFDNDANHFAIAFTATETGAQPQPVYGVVFDYPTFAQPTAYGVGCGPANIGSNSNTHSRKPHSGQEFFALRLTNAPLNAFGALNIGLTPAGTPVPYLPGCFLNVGTIIVGLPANAVGTTAEVPLPIPGGLSGDLFCQFIYVDPAFVNPIPVRATRGLQIEIR